MISVILLPLASYQPRNVRPSSIVNSTNVIVSPWVYLVISGVVIWYASYNALVLSAVQYAADCAKNAYNRI